MGRYRHRLWLPRFDVTTGEGRAEPIASLPPSFLHLVAYKSSVFRSAGKGRYEGSAAPCWLILAIAQLVHCAAAAQAVA